MVMILTMNNSNGCNEQMIPVVKAKDKADLGGGIGKPFTAAEEGREGGKGRSASAGCEGPFASASLPLPAAPHTRILEDLQKCLLISGLSMKGHFCYKHYAIQNQ